MAEKTAVVLIKDFFGMTGKEALSEIKALTLAEREELAKLIAAETGDVVVKKEL